MKITTTATLSKSLRVSREKSDEGEAVIAHLKFTECAVIREDIDGLLGAPHAGWARAALFDELGAPVARMEITPVHRALTASVRLCGIECEMHVAGGVLSAITLTLDKSGALMSGILSWGVAGDETSDLEPLLGQIVRLEASITDGEQGDLLRAA